MSSARNAGESAIRRVPAQPSAEIVRVECAKCRRECDLSGPRATLVFSEESALRNNKMKLFLQTLNGTAPKQPKRDIDTLAEGRKQGRKEERRKEAKKERRKE